MQKNTFIKAQYIYEVKLHAARYRKRFCICLRIFMSIEDHSAPSQDTADQ